MTDRMRRAMTRRKALALIGSAAGAAMAAACAPATSPAASAPGTAAATAATTAPTQAPVTAPPPTPKPTPFALASMKDPLIDNHTHPIVPEQGDQLKYYDGLVQLMDQNNVAFSVMHRNAQWVTPTNTFSAVHDDWVRAAMERHPGRIFGGLGGFDPTSADAPAYVRTQLATGKWAFVGELDLRNPGPKTQIPINSPVMLQVAQVAAEFKVPLVFHYNLDYPSGDPGVGMLELADALGRNPNTTYLIAHNPLPPLMLRYPNLWAELSLFSPFPSQQVVQQLSQTPATLDRLCLCVTDLQTPDLNIVAGLPTPITYKQGTEAARSFLAGYPADVRDKIAYKNLTRLLKLS